LIWFIEKMCINILKLMFKLQFDIILMWQFDILKFVDVIWSEF
jgi:hypothetical protein